MDSQQPTLGEKRIPKHKTDRTLQTNLLEHPAVNAWRELRPENIKPGQIEILKERKNRAVYRLVGVGPDNSAIIAKRAQ